MIINDQNYRLSMIKNKELLNTIKIDTDTIAECVVKDILEEKRTPYFMITMSEDITYMVFKDNENNPVRFEVFEKLRESFNANKNLSDSDKKSLEEQKDIIRKQLFENIPSLKNFVDEKGKRISSKD